MFGGRHQFFMKLPSLSARKIGVFGRGPLGVGPMSRHGVSVVRANGTRPQGGHIALRGAAPRRGANEPSRCIRASSKWRQTPRWPYRPARSSFCKNASPGELLPVGNQGPAQTDRSLHSTSRGLSHGIQMGMGFRDRQGAGNSIALPVPGMHTDTFPRLIHGKIWNSVLSRVGQMGTSNGTEIFPTLSGGIQRSGAQVRAP